MEDRSIQLRRLAEEQYDLCIIGGGASGVGCALDAALRGLKVVLIDKHDIAAETSSRSTKLIHGGVRYLEQAFKKLDFSQLRQVKHGLEERHLVLSNAPHLARPLALLTPVSSWFEGLYFSIGLWLYDQFASSEDLLPKSRWLSKKEALSLIPNLNTKIHSAIMYYDGQLDDARYALAVAQSAAEAGALILNYTTLTAFQFDDNGQINSAIVSAETTDGEVVNTTIKASCFLNCTGPFADAVRLMANPDIGKRIRPSKGVHLTLPLSVTEGPETALLIPKTPDGRVVFAIPFDGSLLLGTTDNDYPELTEEPVLEAAEVDFLLETLEPYLNAPVDKSLVKSGFGGIRPLITATKNNTKSLLRDHEVEHDTNSGLLSLLGGKWTTYRLMAKDAIDAVCRLAKRTETCSTDRHILVGGEHFDVEYWQQLQHDFGFDADTCHHLVNTYGSRAVRVANLTRDHLEWANKILPGHPYIQAEVIYAARHEMTLHIRDFLNRRIRLEILDWSAALLAAPLIGQLLGSVHGWSAEKINTEINNYQSLIHSFVARTKG